MRFMFGARSVTQRFRGLQRSRFCSSTANNGQKVPLEAAGSGNGDNVVTSGGRNFRDLEAYKDLDKLDFMKAAKILFTDPPQKKKFGLDFHLVQLFFVCMPSLAVYLVAQYARYEMRKMEADLELKKNAEEEAKAKEMEEMEAKTAKEKELDPDLLDVKERLQALEEAMKDIVIDKKKPKAADDNSGNKTLHVAKDQTSSLEQNQVDQPVKAKGEGAAQNGVSPSIRTNEKEGAAQNAVSHNNVKK